jgi:hypothetical protein
MQDIQNSVPYIVECVYKVSFAIQFDCHFWRSEKKRVGDNIKELIQRYFHLLALFLSWKSKQMGLLSHVFMPFFLMQVSWNFNMCKHFLHSCHALFIIVIIFNWCVLKSNSQTCFSCEFGISSG